MAKSKATAKETASKALEETSPITVQEESKSELNGAEGTTRADEDTITHDKIQQTIGTRKGGKVWKETKKPLRIKSVGVRAKSWDKKVEERQALQGFKNKAKELKEEKEQERKVSLIVWSEIINSNGIMLTNHFRESWRPVRPIWRLRRRRSVMSCWPKKCMQR